jgi:hypothetical protein
MCRRAIRDDFSRAPRRLPPRRPRSLALTLARVAALALAAGPPSGRAAPARALQEISGIGTPSIAVRRVARYFPGRRRHNLEALTAYGTYPNNSRRNAANRALLLRPPRMLWGGAGRSIADDIVGACIATPLRAPSVLLGDRVGYGPAPLDCPVQRACLVLTSSRPCRPCRPCRLACRRRPFRAARRRSPRSGGCSWRSRRRFGVPSG